MAIVFDLDHPAGVTIKGAYWRLNNFDQLPNRQADGTYSVPVVARFRPYVSQQAFVDGLPNIGMAAGELDMIVSFTPTSVSGNLADEAYAALRAYDPGAEIRQDLASTQGALEALAAEIDSLDEVKKDDPRRAEVDTRIGELRAQAAYLTDTVIPQKEAAVASADALCAKLASAAPA